MYDIEFTADAEADLQTFRKHEQQVILSEIETQLQYEPTLETRNRKRLQPNDIAEWELRVGKFRIFYNVLDKILIVSIEAVGFKIGNILYIRGKRTEL